MKWMCYTKWSKGNKGTSRKVNIEYRSYSYSNILDEIFAEMESYTDVSEFIQNSIKGRIIVESVK